MNGGRPFQKKIAGLGFRGVEIMGHRPHLYPPDFDETDMAEIKETLKKHNLKVTNLNSFTLFAVGDTYLPSWIEPEKEQREIRIRHTLDCLKVAKELGCNNISVPPGGPLNEISRKDALSLFHKGLEQLIPLAEELGIKILVEPEPNLLMENTKEFKPFIKDVKSRMVGLNFDIGHFFCAGEEPAEAFEELFERMNQSRKYVRKLIISLNMFSRIMNILTNCFLPNKISWGNRA